MKILTPMVLKVTVWHQVVKKHNFDKTHHQFIINEESNQPTGQDQSGGVEELLEEDNNNSQSDKEVSTPYVI